MFSREDYSIRPFCLDAIYRCCGILTASKKKKGGEPILKVNLVTLIAWLIITMAIEKVLMEDVEFVHGVVDRLEDQDQAVILVESMNQEWVVAQERFPEITASGMSVIVKLHNDVIVQLVVDVRKTKDREEKSLQLMQVLRQQKDNIHDKISKHLFDLK